MPNKKKSSATAVAVSTAAASASSVQQPGWRRRRKQKDPTSPPTANDTMDTVISQDSNIDIATADDHVDPPTNINVSLRRQVESQQ